MSLEDLRDGLSMDKTVAYTESYLSVETQSREIVETAQDRGALFLNGVEPFSLGIFAPQGEYGTNILCGDGQPLCPYELLWSVLGGSLLATTMNAISPQLVTD